MNGLLCPPTTLSLPVILVLTAKQVCPPYPDPSPSPNHVTTLVGISNDHDISMNEPLSDVHVMAGSEGNRIPIDLESNKESTSNASLLDNDTYPNISYLPFDEYDEEEPNLDHDGPTDFIPPIGSGNTRTSSPRTSSPSRACRFATRLIPNPPEFNNATSSPLQFDDITVNRILSITPSSKNQHELCLAVEYNKLLRNATLNNSGLTPDAVECLRHPRTEEIDLEENFDEKLSLNLFLTLQTYPDVVYTKVVSILNKALPSLSLLSLYRVKKLTRRLSDVATIEHDMCPKSCIAYTGSLMDKDTCYECGSSHWDSRHPDKRVAAAKFTTIAIGPQLQALYSSPETSKLMQYRRQRTQPILEQMAQNSDIKFDVFDDIFMGYDYVHLVKSGTINDSTILLMLSIDGAQLYQH